MAKHRHRIIAEIGPDLRRRLLRRFLPDCLIPRDQANLFCQYLMHAYRVAPDTPYPRAPVLVEILGTYHDPEVSVLVCCVGSPPPDTDPDALTGYAYALLRPDGEPYHLTLAVHQRLERRAAFDRLQLSRVHWLRQGSSFTPVIFNVRFRMAPLQVDRPLGLAAHYRP